jgi:hypothetical protein
MCYPFQSRKQDFIVALLDFVKSSSVGSVLFISGVDLSNRTDAQMLYVLSADFISILFHAT